MRLFWKQHPEVPHLTPPSSTVVQPLRLPSLRMTGSDAGQADEKKKTGAWGEGQGERRWCRKDRSFHLTGSSPMLDLPARTQDRRDAQTLAFLWEIIIRHHHLILWGGSLLDTLPGRIVIMTLAPDQGSLWFACLWGKCVYKSDLKVKVVDFIWVSRVQPWFSHLKSRGCVMVC